MISTLIVARDQMMSVGGLKFSGGIEKKIGTGGEFFIGDSERQGDGDPRKRI